MFHLSAELSGSMNRIRGGAESVSVANIPPCSWTPKPLSGSPVRTTSLVSTWTTWPPGPTELEARDTKHTEKHTRDWCFRWLFLFWKMMPVHRCVPFTWAFVLFLSLPPLEQWVAWAHGNCRPGQGAGALAAGTWSCRRTRRETGWYQSCQKKRRKKTDDVHLSLPVSHKLENEDLRNNRRTEEQLIRRAVSAHALTLAVVEAVDGVIVWGCPWLVEGGACVAEGGVLRVTVVHTGIPGVGVVRLLNLHCNTHTHYCFSNHSHVLNAQFYSFV